MFPDPDGILSDGIEIPGLDGRNAKSYGNSIMLSATAEETAKLIKKSKTDSDRFITFLIRKTALAFLPCLPLRRSAPVGPRSKSPRKSATMVQAL